MHNAYSILRWLFRKRRLENLDDPGVEGGGLVGIPVEMTIRCEVESQAIHVVDNVPRGSWQLASAYGSTALTLG
jgi:hypothetical protein